MRIFKWSLPVTDMQTVMIHAGAKLLDVQVQAGPMQNHFAQLWALCDENAPKEPRHISIYGTGNPMPDEPGEYIATFQMHGGNLVFHAFEVAGFVYNEAGGTMQATYIEVNAEVRYWEDATVNGVEDTDGTLIPLRKGDCWTPVIRLSDGMVMGWSQGTTADVHFKICDAGEYWLQDADGKRVAKWAGFYVPDDFLCHGDNGYGDYIIFKVGADGLIEKWRTPDVRMVCPCNEDDQDGWGAVA